MRRLGLLNQRWRAIAVSALVLLLLASGLCILDPVNEDFDGHGFAHDLCLIAVLLPTVTLLLAGLVACGSLTADLTPVLTKGLLTILDPPPRPSLV
jgi:hypothetical protein